MLVGSTVTVTATGMLGSHSVYGYFWWYSGDVESFNYDFFWWFVGDLYGSCFYFRWLDVYFE